MRRFAPFALPLVFALAGCGPTASPSPSGEPGLLEITVVAGPVCPVETVPPDPACEPRPVEGARILVQPGDGRDIVVGEGTTDADGVAMITLPPGDYIVVGTEVAGLMGLPEPTTATVVAGETVEVALAYDTGIR
jgi:hypothetical protein